MFQRSFWEDREKSIEISLPVQVWSSLIHGRILFLLPSGAEPSVVWAEQAAQGGR